MSETETSEEDSAAQPSEDEAAEPGEEGEKSREELKQELEQTRAKLEQAKDERDEFEEKFLRKAADYKNLRERKQDEIQKLKKYSGDDVLKSVLEILDNLDRTLDEIDFESDEVKEGVEMIQRQVEKLLNNQGVERMEAQGDVFEPKEHEAMMQKETEEYDQRRVLDVVRSGYHFHDRILRPARVVVGKPVTDTEDSDGDETTDDSEQSPSDDSESANEA